MILIDNLYTDFGDPDTEAGSGFARLQTLQTLRSIPAGERIAIYAQGRKLQVICEFTSDRDLLERQLVLTILPGHFDTTQMISSRAAAVAEGKRLDAAGRVSAGN